MQKTGFLIPGLERGVNHGCDHYGSVDGHFQHDDNPTTG